jgi:hypothetical protein
VDNNRLNCWELLKCGREPGGMNVDELGVCAATTSIKHDGINNGMNGGRYCWAITGTYCKGEVQGTFARKIKNCIDCKLFLQVQSQEGRGFVFLPEELA